MESIKTTLNITTHTDHGFINVESFESNHRFFSIIKIGLKEVSDYTKEYEISSTEKLPGICLSSEHDKATRSVINYESDKFIETTINLAIESLGTPADSVHIQ